jgi:hypothetical protein
LILVAVVPCHTKIIANMVVCILQRSFYVTIGCVAFGVRSRQALMVKMVNSEVRGQG